MKNTYQEYNEIELISDVMSASSHRLIQLLMNKCLAHIETAKKNITNNDMIPKHQALKKALDILDYLRVCLNFKDPKAHELSSQLDALYAYLERNLVQANMKNDNAYLDEATKLLSTIKEGWDGMAAKEEV